VNAAVATMELKLKVLGGKNAGVEIAVAGPQFLIGRADECQLRPKSDFVSRRHAAIIINDAKATIRDLGSRTGTFVNGAQLAVNKPVEIANGDTVKVGPLEFTIVVKHGLDRQKKPKVESIQDAAARTAQGGEDVDVTQWLQPTEEETSLNETLEGPYMGSTLLSAADLIGQRLTDAPAPTAEETAKREISESRPDQAASDMLKNYLRRR
jgi:predicted component of type VI protein secretion system